MMELLAMSDRINVMRDGEIVAELQKNEFSEENILKYSIGVTMEGSNLGRESR